MLALGVSWLILAPMCLWLLLRGRGSARLGGVVALAGLEAATIWVNSTAGAPTAPAARPAAVPAPAAVQAAAPARERAACATRLPSPERARPAPRRGEVRAVRLSWTAVAGECDTATVVLRRDRRDIKVWLHEGVMKHRPAGARTVPVSVAGGTASVEMRLASPLPGGERFRAIDGRTGRPIAPR